MKSPARSARPLCVFLDAEIYMQRIECLPLIEGLVDARAIPPVHCLFVSSGSALDRHTDFTCNDRFASFLAGDVVAWAQAHIEVLANGNLIAGVSLSGLAAAHAALRHPFVFSLALCQSGSFWWLAGREMPFHPAHVKVWLSVGNEETAKDVLHPPTGLLQTVSQVDGVRSAADLFESLGASVKYREFSGAHDCAAWRHDLAPALRWLIGDLDR